MVDVFNVGQLEGDEALVTASKGRLCRNDFLDFGGDRGAAAEVVVACASDNCTASGKEKGIGTALGSRFGGVSPCLLLPSQNNRKTNGSS